MTRGILVAGNESSLFSVTAAEAVKRVASFVSVQIPNRFPLPDGGAVFPPKAGPPKAELAGAIPLPWNPASALSARTLVLAAENQLKQINDAILICSPPAVFKTAGTLTPEEIDILLNDHIKGWFFLVRELILYFRRSGAGSLSLVTPDIGSGSGGKNAPVDLLGPSSAASFRAFTQSLLATSANEVFNIMGFTTTETGTEADFTAWFFRIIDEAARKNSGRMHKYARLGFFK